MNISIVADRLADTGRDAVGVIHDALGVAAPRPSLEQRKGRGQAT